MRISTVCTCRYQSAKFYKWDSKPIYVAPPALTGVSVNNPLGMIGYIDEKVNMPTITFEATPQPANAPLSGLTFHWYLTIDHTQGNITTQTVRVPASGTIDITGSKQWTPSWPKVAGGNNVQVYVSVSNSKGSTPTTKQGPYKIWIHMESAFRVAF